MADSVPSARDEVERAARELLRVLSVRSGTPSLRVAEVEGSVACLIQVWDARGTMPTVGAERRRRSTSARSECREDVLEVVRTAGEAVTRKEVLRALRLAGKIHGTGTVAKALAELTTSGELVNPKDKKGYRLPAWVRPHPTLFG